MNTTSVKVILIVAVIIDHSNLSRLYIGDFLYGFSFHVVGFYALYFHSAQKKQLKISDLINIQGVRYGYPFVVFLFTLSFVFCFIEKSNPFDHMTLTMKALYSGYHVYLKQSANVYLLWFLPSFLSFIVLVWIYGWAKSVSPRIVITCMTIIFLFIPFISESVIPLLPLGVLTSLYILFLVAVINYLYFGLFFSVGRYKKIFGLGVVFLLVKYLQIRSKSFQEIGFLQVETFLSFPHFVLNFLESVSGVMLVFSLSVFSFGKIVGYLGKYSLQAYLTHIFVALFFESLFRKFGVSVNLGLFVGIVVLTIFGTIGSSFVLMNNRHTSRFLFPKDTLTLCGAIHR